MATAVDVVQAGKNGNSGATDEYSPATCGQTGGQGDGKFTKLERKNESMIVIQSRYETVPNPFCFVQQSFRITHLEFPSNRMNSSTPLRASL